MNILVCIKMVSQAQFTDSLNDAATDRLSGGQLVMNPADSYALELALRIKDRKSGTFITVLTMAPQYAEYILRTALAMGADKAVHICDRAFAGSDTLMTSVIISKCVKQLPPQDLILCGQNAIDSETGHIGPQLAALLDMPCASNVTGFSLNPDGGIDLIRSQGSGLVELHTDCAAVLSVCNGTSMVRSPSIRGMRRSKSMLVDLVDAKTLGLNDAQAGVHGSGTQTISVAETCFKKRAHETAADAGQAVERICKMLAEVKGNG